MSKPDKNSFLYFFVRTIVTVLVVLALLVTHPTAHFDAVSNLDTVTQLDTNRMLDMVKQSKRDTRTMITNNVGVSDTNRLDILENLALLAKQGHQLYMNYSYDRSISNNSRDCWNFDQKKSSFPAIPLILHQQWRSRIVTTHSPMAKQCQKTIQKYASEFFHVIWTDTEIDNFIQKFYPKVWPYYVGLNKKIKKTDYARYLIVHKYGGLYLDLDIELKNNVVDLIQSYSVQSKLEFVSYFVQYKEAKKENFAGNAFFAAVPESPILQIMIDHMLQWNDPKSTNTLDKEVWDVLRHTGPIGLGSAVHKFTNVKETSH